MCRGWFLKGGEADAVGLDEGEVEDLDMADR